MTEEERGEREEEGRKRGSRWAPLPHRALPSWPAPA